MLTEISSFIETLFTPAEVKVLAFQCRVINTDTTFAQRTVWCIQQHYNMIARD